MVGFKEMEKITKDKKNWFKIQFEKHPYLFTFLIGWPALFFIIDKFIAPNDSTFSDPIENAFTVLVYYLSPLEFNSIHPSVKFFLSQVEKDTLIIICLCHFH